MMKVDYSNPNNVRFKDLIADATEAFGEPRIAGSHHVFKTPWQGKPWVNLQKSGGKAKPYQVKQVREALEKLKDFKEIDNEKSSKKKSSSKKSRWKT